MKAARGFLFAVVVFLCVAPVAAERENCRLFGAVSGRAEHETMLGLYLKNFARSSRPQENGWSLSCYGDLEDKGRLAIPGYPMVIRSHVPVHEDEAVYGRSTELITRMTPRVILGHLRNASSGCAQAADPHPFLRQFRGKWYLFQHNGGVWDEGLGLLIHDLVAGWAEPKSCPQSPIDSEYLFLYLLRIMEEEGLDEADALVVWARRLRAKLGTPWNALNVLLTDGETVWGVRCVRRGLGFYLHYEPLDGDMAGWAVSTEAPSAQAIPLSNNELVILRPFEPSEVRSFSLQPSLR